MRQTYTNLWVTALTPEQHERTCGYWYTVTAGAMAHTAFATRRGLDRWLSERNLTIEKPITDKTGESSKIIGEYADDAHMSYDEFFGLPYVIETKALSNGDYTLGLITEEEGIRCVHTLNPNCKFRPEFNYFDARLEMN